MQARHFPGTSLWVTRGEYSAEIYRMSPTEGHFSKVEEHNYIHKLLHKNTNRNLFIYLFWPP